MTTYGMPYLLEDKTGKLTGSDFVDINDRFRLTLRCTARGSTHTTYIIYDKAYMTDSVTPLVTLNFGPNHSLGTISFGSGAQIPINEFLVETSAHGRLVSISHTSPTLIVIQRENKKVRGVRWPSVQMELEEYSRGGMDGRPSSNIFEVYF